MTTTAAAPHFWNCRICGYTVIKPAELRRLARVEAAAKAAVKAQDEMLEPGGCAENVWEAVEELRAALSKVEGEAKP